MVKRIFVCSRLRGDTQKQYRAHVEQAMAFSRFVVNAGYGSPFTPHLLYPLFLDDSIKLEREAGIQAGLAYLDVCDGLFVFVADDEYVSIGMKKEIQYAFDKSIPVYIFKKENDVIAPQNSLLDVWTTTWLNAI